MSIMSETTHHFVNETHCIGEKTFFTWKICDYHASPLENDGFLFSDTFVIEKIPFCLKAFCKFKRDDLTGDFWLYVRLVVNGTLQNEYFTYYISLKNKENEFQYRRRGFVQCGQKPTALRIVLKDQLSYSTGLLVDDCLTICCTVLWCGTTKLRAVQGTVSCSRSDALTRDLWSLFTSKNTADIVLRVEGQDIPVHSQILSARSSVFAAMFRNDFIENRTRVVNISDLGISVINCLLQYIYTAEARELNELSSDSLVELYTAAEKYDLKGLKDMCSQVIQTKMSKDNVEKYVTLAVTHDDQNVMAAAVALFGSNKSLMDSDLMHELAKKIPTLPVQILKFVAKGM